jgi:hypothetical protein
MSVARGNGQNGGRFYSNITQPVKIDLNFVVDPANGNGLGIRSLKSNGYVNNVFMHTTSAPGTNNGQTNPNPEAGYCLITMTNNYKVYLGGFDGFVSPLSGGALVAVTAGLAYVITSLGTTTLAQWQAAGVPAGFVPAVGMSFIAIETGAIGGTGTVQVPGVSGIASAEAIGNANLSISNASLAQNAGAQLLLQFLSGAGALTAPATGSVCGMSIFMDISSATIDGL